jgi:hypothetical protein
MDRIGIFLSGLCALHCILSIVIVMAIGVSGGFLFDPFFHRAGLAIALMIAAVAIGYGALQHRKPAPFVVAMMGMSFMGGALAVDHGIEEAVLTIIGVALVGTGHILNMRHFRTQHKADRP